MDVCEPSTQSWRVKSLHVDEKHEEGTDCGGEQLNCEVPNWRVREGFSCHSEVNSGWSVHVGED